MTQWTVDDLMRLEWFEPLMQQVQQELDRTSQEQTDRRPALAHAVQELQTNICGWSQTLANPNLSPAVRDLVEGNLAQAIGKKADLERQLAEHEAARERIRTVVNPQQTVDQLNRLAEILAGDNPTRGNLELALHIDSIRCYQDGRVVMRTCKLGALAGVAEVVANPNAGEACDAVEETGVVRATPRRRARLRVANRDERGDDLRAAAAMAADIHRFAGLGPEWFWEETFDMPEKTCWAADNATAVAAKKGATNWPLSKLAAFFGKTKPTIAKALRIAAERAKTEGESASA
jgi:hypothetical protein